MRGRRYRDIKNSKRNNLNQHSVERVAISHTIASTAKISEQQKKWNEGRQRKPQVHQGVVPTQNEDEQHQGSEECQ